MKTKAPFLEHQLLSNQSEQSEKFSKSSNWLEKIWPSKEATFVLISGFSEGRLFYQPTRAV